MSRIVMIYGLIAGTIVTTLMLLSIHLWMEDMHDMGTGEIIGYTTMLIALSLIFFGVKTYRDKHNAGVISFKRAFLIGLYITLVASVMYTLGWMIYSAAYMPDFAEKYTEAQVEKMREEGMSEEVIVEKSAEMQGFVELYKNPLIKFGMTMMEIFPVGLLITLLTAAILRRRPPTQVVT